MKKYNLKNIGQSLGLAISGTVLAVTLMALPTTQAEASAPGCSTAGDNSSCSDILGVAYRYLSYSQDESFSSRALAWLNTLTREEVRKVTSSGTSIGVPGLFSLDSSDSEEEWRKFEEWRQSGRSEAVDHKKLVNLVQGGPDPVAIEAWRTCMLDVNREGVQVVDEVLYLNKVLLTYRYNASPRRGAARSTVIDRIEVTVEGEKRPRVVSAKPIELHDRVPKLMPEIGGVSAEKRFTVKFFSAKTGDWTRSYAPRPKPNAQTFFRTSIASFEMHSPVPLEYGLRIKVNGKDIGTPAYRTIGQPFQPSGSVETQYIKGKDLTFEVYINSGGFGPGDHLIFSKSIPMDQLKNANDYGSPQFDFGHIRQGIYGALSVRVEAFKR